MELTTGFLSREEYLQAIDGIIDFMAAAGVRTIFVAYGFGCDCPEEEMYQDTMISLNRLLPFIDQAEALDYYRVGQDNLHVKDESGRIEFLLCHESDIHFISEDKDLMNWMKARWIEAGYEVQFVKDGGKE